VIVVDGVSGAPICDATVTAQGGVYDVTLIPMRSMQGDCWYDGVSEPGTYTVTATLGARSKAASVQVPSTGSGACDHVVTQSVTITLDP
jgi:hypothetical protein